MNVRNLDSGEIGEVYGTALTETGGPGVYVRVDADAQGNKYRPCKWAVWGRAEYEEVQDAAASA